MAENQGNQNRGRRRNRGGGRGRRGGGNNPDNGGAPGNGNRDAGGGQDQQRGRQREPKPKNLLREKNDGYQKKGAYTLDRGGRVLIEDGGKKYFAIPDFWPGMQPGERSPSIADGTEVKVAVVEYPDAGSANGTKKGIVIFENPGDIDTFKRNKQSEFNLERTAGKNVDYGKGSTVKDAALTTTGGTEFIGHANEAEQMDPTARVFNVKTFIPVWPADLAKADIFVTEAPTKHDKKETNYRALFKTEVDASVAYQSMRETFLRNKNLLSVVSGPETAFESLLKDGAKDDFMRESAEYQALMSEVTAEFVTIAEAYADIQRINAPDPDAVAAQIKTALTAIDAQLKNIQPKLNALDAKAQDVLGYVKNAKSMTVRTNMTPEQQRAYMKTQLEKASTDPANPDAARIGKTDALFAALEDNAVLAEAGRTEMERQRHGGALFDVLQEALNDIGVNIEPDALLDIHVKDGPVILTKKDGTTDVFSADTAITSFYVAGDVTNATLVLMMGSDEYRLPIKDAVKAVKESTIHVFERSKAQGEFKDALLNGDIPFADMVRFVEMQPIPGYEQYDPNTVDEELYNEVHEVMLERMLHYFGTLVEDDVLQLMEDREVVFGIPREQRPRGRGATTVQLKCMLSFEDYDQVLLLSGDAEADKAYLTQEDDGPIVELKKAIEKFDADKAAAEAAPAETDPAAEAAEKKALSERAAKAQAARLRNKLSEAIGTIKEYKRPSESGSESGPRSDVLKRLDILIRFYGKAPDGKPVQQQLLAMVGDLQDVFKESERISFALDGISQDGKIAEIADGEHVFDSAEKLIEKMEGLRVKVDASVAEMTTPMREKEAVDHLPAVMKELQEAMAQENKTRSSIERILSAGDKVGGMESRLNTLRTQQAKVQQLQQQVIALQGRITDPRKIQHVDIIVAKSAKEDTKYPVKELLPRAQRQLDEAQREMQRYISKHTKTKKEGKGKDAPTTTELSGHNETILNGLKQRYEVLSAYVEQLTEQEAMISGTSDRKRFNMVEATQNLENIVRDIAAIAAEAELLANHAEDVFITLPLPENAKDMSAQQWHDYMPESFQVRDGLFRKFEKGTAEALFEKLAAEFSLPDDGGDPKGYYVKANGNWGAPVTHLHDGRVYKVTPKKDSASGIEGVQVVNVVNNAGTMVERPPKPGYLYYRNLIGLLVAGELVAGDSNGGPEDPDDGPGGGGRRSPGEMSTTQTPVTELPTTISTETRVTRAKLARAYSKAIQRNFGLNPLMLRQMGTINSREGAPLKAFPVLEDGIFRVVGEQGMPEDVPLNVFYKRLRDGDYRRNDGGMFVERPEIDLRNIAIEQAEAELLSPADATVGDIGSLPVVPEESENPAQIFNEGDMPVEPTELVRTISREIQKQFGLNALQMRQLGSFLNAEGLKLKAAAMPDAGDFRVQDENGNITDLPAEEFYRRFKAGEYQRSTPASAAEQSPENNEKVNDEPTILTTPEIPMDQYQSLAPAAPNESDAQIFNEGDMPDDGVHVQAFKPGEGERVIMSERPTVNANPEVVEAEAAPGDNPEDREEHLVQFLSEQGIAVSDLINGSLHDQQNRSLIIRLGNNARAFIEHRPVNNSQAPQMETNIPLEQIEERVQAGEIRKLTFNEAPTTDLPAPEAESRPEVKEYYAFRENLADREMDVKKLESGQHLYIAQPDNTVGSALIANPVTFGDTRGVKILNVDAEQQRPGSTSNFEIVPYDEFFERYDRGDYRYFANVEDVPTAEIVQTDQLEINDAPSVTVEIPRTPSGRYEELSPMRVERTLRDEFKTTLDQINQGGYLTGADGHRLTAQVFANEGQPGILITDVDAPANATDAVRFFSYTDFLTQLREGTELVLNVPRRQVAAQQLAEQLAAIDSDSEDVSLELDEPESDISELDIEEDDDFDDSVVDGLIDDFFLDNENALEDDDSLLDSVAIESEGEIPTDETDGAFDIPSNVRPRRESANDDNREVA